MHMQMFGHNLRLLAWPSTSALEADKPNPDACLSPSKAIRVVDAMSMDPKDFIVRQATNAEDFKQCMTIRREVFVDEQGYDPSIEVNDAEDTDCAHFICLAASGEAVGTVRLYIPRAKLGRLAIRKPYRGLGLGRPLCHAVLAHMKALGGREVIADVEADKTIVDATGFYAKFGFVPRGPTWIKLGCVHQLMVYDLSRLAKQAA